MPRIETRKKGGLPEPVIKTTTDFPRQYFFSNTYSIESLFWEFGPLLHLTTGSRILSSEKEATGPGQPQSCQEIAYSERQWPSRHSLQVPDVLFT